MTDSSIKCVPNQKNWPSSSWSDQDSVPESISDTENCLNWNGDMGNPNASECNWEADDESDIELENGIEAL